MTDEIQTAPDAAPVAATDPTFEMRSRRSSLLRMVIPGIVVFVTVAILGELLVPSESKRAAFVVPAMILAEGIVVWRCWRLFIRVDASGVLVKNFLETEHVAWEQMLEMTACDDFGLNNTTAAFRPRGETGLLRTIAAAQVTSSVASRKDKRALLEVLHHYSEKYGIPCYLDLGYDNDWYVPTNAFGERVARVQANRPPAAASPATTQDDAAAGPRGSRRIARLVPALFALGPVIVIAAANGHLNVTVAIAGIALGLAYGLMAEAWHRHQARRG